MFTGIVHELGRIESLAFVNEGLRVSVLASSIIPQLSLGDSVSVNGVCSTVVLLTDGSFLVEYLPETLNKTTFSFFQEGEYVNLELSLKATSFIGGHFVSGHVDSVGCITRLSKSDPWGLVEISYEGEFYPYVVPKGSVTVNGVSLTVVDSKRGLFSCHLIPHTFENTIFSFNKVDDKVNLEFDIISKHIVHYMRTLE